MTAGVQPTRHSTPAESSLAPTGRSGRSAPRRSTFLLILIAAAASGLLFVFTESKVGARQADNSPAISIGGTDGTNIPTESVGGAATAVERTNQAGTTAGTRYEKEILEALSNNAFGEEAGRFLAGDYAAIRRETIARGGNNEAVRAGLRVLFGGRALVYWQGCTIGNVRDEVEELNTAEGQLASCRGRNQHAGYYTYRTDERRIYRMEGVTGLLFLTFVAAPGRKADGDMRSLDAGVFVPFHQGDRVVCAPDGDVSVCRADGVQDMEIPRFRHLDLVNPQGWIEPK